MKSKSEVLSIVSRQLDNAIGAIGSDAIQDTRRALDYYHGRPYGTEVKGSSKVVTREMLETVEWTQPSLLRIFCSGDRVVNFEASSAEDEAQSDQETDYLNYVFLQDNDGYSVSDAWFRSAQVERVGYVKATWEERRKKRLTTYDGLSEIQLAQVLAGQYGQKHPFDHVEVLAQETYQATDLMGQPAFDPMTGEPIPLFNVRVRETRIEKRAEVVNVPREEMRVSKDTASLNLDTASMVAQVRDMTPTELIEMGVPKEVVDTLPRRRTYQKTRQNINYSRQVERGSQRTEHQASDEAMMPIEVAEVYIRIDEDEDGIAELRRIMYAGSEILEDEEVDYQPFVALCPIPMPFTHIGLGTWDLTSDLQLINSTLWRGMLDNIALTNSPEWLMVEEECNAEDFAQSHAGRQKRVDNIQTSAAPVTVPFAAAASIPLIEMLDVIKERRTGVSKQSTGVDAEALSKSTLGAFSLGLGQSNQRLETIARTFAETGFKWLFVKLRELVTRHQDRPRVVELRGQYVEIDPRTWQERSATKAQVGLGTGGQHQSLAYLAQVAQKQEEHIEKGSPLADWGNLYYTYSRMLAIIGEKNATRFWQDPATEEFQQALAQRAEQARQQAEAQQETTRGLMSVEMAKIAQRADEADKKAIVDLQKLREQQEQRADDSEQWRTELEVKEGANVPGSAV